MKVKIEIDCTPEEARAFLGMPDMRPLHDELMADLKERMTEAAKGLDPEEALKTWMGASSDGMNQMMDFWRQMTDASGKSKP